MSARVRFAPSPTGSLHIGNARTALFNWLFARKHGGRFILRIEDTDRERSRPEWERAILEDLGWLGLHWDEGPDVGGDAGPYRQSERLPTYRAAADRLLGEGKAYFCFCSLPALEAQRQERLARGLPPRYDGRCRAIPSEEVARRRGSGEAAAVRFVVPSERIAVHDLVKGNVEFLGSDLDDFVILRADGSPSYNFAAAVDDCRMVITHVIRGDDHLANTPRQMAVARALGWESPNYAHVPLILGWDGAPLSKRHGSFSIDEFRDTGFIPEAVVNYLGLLGWSPPQGAPELMPLNEMAERFILDRVSHSPARFDQGRLLWFNRQYLHRMPLDRLLRLLAPAPPDDLTARAVEALRADADSMAGLERTVASIRAEPEPQTLRLTPEDRHALEAVYESLASASLNTAGEAKELLERVARGLPGKKPDLMHAARLALLGLPQGPPVATLLWILGPERARRRLARALTATVGS